jgi:hypothetical protein
VSAVNGEETATLSENQIADTRKRSLRLVENRSSCIDPPDQARKSETFRWRHLSNTRFLALFIIIERRR